MAVNPAQVASAVTAQSGEVIIFDVREEAQLETLGQQATRCPAKPTPNSGGARCPPRPLTPPAGPSRAAMGCVSGLGWPDGDAGTLPGPPSRPSARRRANPLPRCPLAGGGQLTILPAIADRGSRTIPSSSACRMSPG